MESRNKSVLLDVDPSIIENNLLITDPDGGLDSLFPKEPAPQSKIVNPIPGLCVKVRRATLDRGKVFINMCHTKDIPAPEEINEQRLVELWNVDDHGGTCDYRVPLSIGEARTEPDKSGQPSDVYDVAVNTTFFGKVETSNIFRMFMLDVVMQGVEDKFNIELDKDDYVVMKNRRAMGNIPPHRVRVDDKQSQAQPPMPLVQELGTIRYSEPTSPGPAPSVSKPVTKPEFRLVRKPAVGSAKSLVAQIQLSDVISANEVTLDVGEDRLILSGGARRKNYHLDLFLPLNVVQNRITASFDGASKILTVMMPVVQDA